MDKPRNVGIDLGWLFLRCVEDSAHSLAGSKVEPGFSYRRFPGLRQITSSSYTTPKLAINF
ncbi:hypothetical protein DGG96_12515 [Legionella qingyii]|uniref:Uncharacterized protein n=1 Tax=Legionella qingyii TaxID=2184757 RepID=A0A317TZU9_9GAMM|nr:hypothetical protein DGG96_12515 [Legionella qingyii]